MDEPIRHVRLNARQVEGLRQATPAERLATALGLTALTLELADAGRRARERPHH